MDTDSSREGRRRKILARGSDRLALITGQARSQPPSTVATPPPPTERGGGEVEELLPGAVGPAGDDIGSLGTAYEFPKSELNSTTVRHTIDRSTGAKTFPGCEKIDEAADITQHNNAKIESVTVHGPYRQVTDIKQRGKGRTHELFTAKRISTSITASENIRMLCAASIALLVVLSYHGYPVGGEAIGSIIRFRPIYLVLLTDASLMLGILFTSDWKEKAEADAEGTGEESKDWMDQMSKALEVVIVLQKVASAAFFDCCLSAVIIICGTSFGRIP